MPIWDWYGTGWQPNLNDGRRLFSNVRRSLQRDSANKEIHWRLFSINYSRHSASCESAVMELAMIALSATYPLRWSTQRWVRCAHRHALLEASTLQRLYQPLIDMIRPVWRLWSLRGVWDIPGRCFGLRNNPSLSRVSITLSGGTPVEPIQRSKARRVGLFSQVEQQVNVQLKKLLFND